MTELSNNNGFTIQGKFTFRDLLLLLSLLGVGGHSYYSAHQAGQIVDLQQHIRTAEKLLEDCRARLAIIEKRSAPKVHKVSSEYNDVTVRSFTP